MADLTEAIEHARRMRETLLLQELLWSQRVAAELAELRGEVHAAEARLEMLLARHA